MPIRSPKSFAFVLLSSTLAVGGAGYMALAPKVGPLPGGGEQIPTGQIVQPWGKVLTLPGSRPVDVALSADAKWAYLKDNRGLVRVDTASWRTAQTLPFERGGGSMHGICIARDGTVYASGSQSVVWEATAGTDGTLTLARSLSLPINADGSGGASYPCGIALSSDEKTLYVCLSRANVLAVVDRATGKVTARIPVGVAPYDVVLSPDNKTAYVSDWGGRTPKPGEQSAPSSGTPVLVDKRGVGASGTISFVDIASGKQTGQVAVGLHPSDMVLSPDSKTLFVANANSDTISHIDVATQTVRETTIIRPDNALPIGTAPNALVLTPDGKTLYVACAGINAVAVVAPGTSSAKSQVKGFLPTGWYPGALYLQNGSLYVAGVKGLGSRNRPESSKRNGYSVYDYTGTFERISVPLSATDLARATAQVKKFGQVAQAVKATKTGTATPVSKIGPVKAIPKSVPIPTQASEVSAIRHVVYIIKENRTYDQVLGDLAQGNGDKTLCLYGRSVTPNHHALAEEFVLLDNFYCNGVLSADGHSWVTEGNVTDHLEKSFGGFTRSYTFGDDPLTYSSSGFIWNPVLERGLTFRNWGEMNYATLKPTGRYTEVARDWQNKAGKFTFTHNIGITSLREHSSPDYPGWNMEIPDRLRADIFLRDLTEYEKSGKNFPNLSLVYLPNDHTEGLRSGAPTPQAYMGDNDLALGRIVESLTKSRYWPQMAIFVIEDDPQDGFDHVDGHRSLCFVVSPYTRRGVVDSNFYNQTSVLHTIGRIFGFGPLNQMTGIAPVMTTCFTPQPDLRPYTCKPATTNLEAVNPPASTLHPVLRPYALASAKLPLTKPDQADEDTLNRILWYAAKGPNTSYPAHLAGAHGKGLAKAGLRLAPQHEEKEEDEDD